MVTIRNEQYLIKCHLKCKKPFTINLIYILNGLIERVNAWGALGVFCPFWKGSGDCRYCFNFVYVLRLH